MYIHSDATSLSSDCPINVPSLPHDKSSCISLDMAGVTSLLGGDDALSAMAAVHIYENRCWLGWYNNPGSFQMARRLNSFAKSASLHNASGSRNCSPGCLSTHCVHMDPITLLELDNRGVPKFRAAHSGTIIEETSYFAKLFMKECAAWESEERVVSGRRTQPAGITIADLRSTPTSKVLAARSSAFTSLLASIPIITSVGGCALSAAFGDWYSSLCIILGVTASGLFSFVLGSADFVFTHPEPTSGSLAGDGILYSDEGIVLLKGTEGAVSSITHGSFCFRLSCEGHYNLVRVCSVLYFIQGVTQLFLTPQASLFGQVMFLISLAVSALYNAWLVLLNKEQSLGRIFFERVLRNPTLTKFTFGSRTTAVVFALLVLRLQDPTKLLDDLLPEDTKVWMLWKTTILEWLHRPNDQFLQLGSVLGDLNGFTQEEKASLELLYEDALDAYNGHRKFFRAES